MSGDRRLTADVRVEEVPGVGEEFAHVHGPINLDAVVGARLVGQ